MSVANGYGSKATGNYSIVQGANSTASGKGSIVLGANSKANADSSLALGESSVASAKDGVAIGHNSQVGANSGIAIGAESVADREALNTDMLGAVSVGGNGKTRQIINVAAGTEDTDVVNVSQLKREAAAREDGDKNTLIQSKNYSDSRDKNTLVQANSYTNRTVSTASASTLAKANQYTNEKFNSLKKQVDNNRKRSDSGIAGAMAMTALAPVPYKDYSFGMAMAGYREEGAIAAGFNIKTSDNSLMKVSASWDSQNGGGVAAGFNVGW
ncbi:hypothetical protein ED309_23430, partial [Escherichia coli]|nr:hypothetical protein [Escherichia coli]